VRQQNSHFYITPRFCGKNVKELSKLKIPASCSVGHFFFGVITSLPIEMRSIAMSVSVCLSVCLSVCTSVRSRISETARQHFAKFSLHVIVAVVARSSSGRNAICYVLPVLWMTSSGRSAMSTIALFWPWGPCRTDGSVNRWSPCIYASDYQQRCV